MGDSNETAALVQSKIPEPANGSSGGCCYEDGCQSCNPAGHYCDSNDTCSNECKGTWCGPAAPAPPPTPAATGGCCYEDGCQSCNPAGHYCDSESACTNECKGTWCGSDSNETAALVQSKIPEPANESANESSGGLVRVGWCCDIDLNKILYGAETWCAESEENCLACHAKWCPH